MGKAAKWDANRLVLPVTFALIALFLVVRTIVTSASNPLFQDTDDAMRMVVVRDFLAGQNWFDHIQHRLNTPFGGDIHWSRLVDLPIAALLLITTPFAGSNAATIVGYLYPLLLLLILLVLSGKLTQLLVGKEGLLAACLLPAFAPLVVAEFSPGRIDHHSIQILLSLGLAYCTIAALSRPRFAIGAGILAATSLAIGTEGIVIIAAAISAFALNWVFVEGRGPVLRAFGISFGAATAVHLAIYLPPQSWLTPACDALSIVYVLAAIGTGLAFTTLSFLPASRPLARLAAATVLGGALLAGLALAYPICLKGPYGALDPWLVSNWLDRVSEARPLLADLLVLSPIAAGLFVPLSLAVVMTILAVRRAAPGERGKWLVLALFLVAAIAVTAFQIRGGRLAMPLAIPALAYAIAAARQRYLRRASIGSVLGLVGAWLASAGLVSAVALGALGLQLRLDPNAPAPFEPPAIGRNACLLPELFVDLAGLPPERIMTPVDLGAHMLLYTPHAVVSAPYHRNQQAVRDTFDFFNKPLADMRQILDARGIGLVITCPYLSEMKGGLSPTPDSFIALLDRGSLPEWLVDQSLPDSPIRVFAVLPNP